MKLHITLGTLSYLASKKEKQPELMLNAKNRDALLYTESDSGDSPFDSGSDYNILHSYGSLNEDNAVYVQYIPVSGSGDASILGHLSDLNQELQNINGLLAYRLGHSADKSSFIIFTQWPGTSTISDFKDSDVYKNYLTTDVLKRFRDAGALFQSSSSSRIYVTVEENEEDLEALPEEEKEDY